jgi:hypothetical protein
VFRTGGGQKRVVQTIPERKMRCKGLGWRQTEYNLGHGRPKWKFQVGGVRR